MHLRLFFQANQGRPSDYKFPDDKEDELYAADQDLSFKQRTNNSFNSLLLKQKQGKSSIQEFVQTFIPNKVLFT